MSRKYILPLNYTIYYARNRVDRWVVYKSLVLNREDEASRSKLVAVLLNPHTLIWLALLILVLLFLSFVFASLHNWINILLISVFIVFGYVGLLHLVLLYELLIENGRRLIIVSYRKQLIGYALMAFQENHSVLMGLYIAPSHRHKGVGSYLVQCLLQRDRLPIYLNAKPKLCSFYTRFGFVETNSQRGYNMVIRALK